MPPDNDDRKQSNRNSHPLLSLPHGFWVWNENPQASPGKDDLFAESGLSFLPPPRHEDSPPKRKGVSGLSSRSTRAAGKFSSHLSEHGFSLKSSPNICSHRTLTCCRCLQTPEVKNQEQSWCEPLWETHPVWVNPLDSVLLNSECPDFLHKYTSSISLSSTYTLSHGKNN